MALSLEELRVRLAAFITRESGSTAHVSLLRPLAGGASRAAYALEVELEGGAGPGRRDAVLRLDLGGKIYAAALSRRDEASVLRAARAGGVRVPQVFWESSDPAVLGRDFMVLERIEGETIGRRIVSRPELAGARKLLPRALGLELARIHAVNASALGFLERPAAGEAPARSVLRRTRQELGCIAEPHPALEIGWRWLWDRAPESPRVVLVHGDYRLGNVVVGPEGLRAVLDWEFTALGDPHEDLAWPFVRDWRFGNDSARFAGLSDGETFLSAYEEASGGEVDRASLQYWEVMGNFRWALGCLTQARRHLRGEEPSVELASLGRRAAEMELELLDLIASSGSA